MKALDSLKNYRKDRNCTLLGVGPMSKNCVDATIELAEENNVPIMLIASRRQVDSQQFGGGYVENWTSQQFASYVRENDPFGHIIIARDHGGPWQNELEISKKMNLFDAMKSAKDSFKADIDAGFQMLHIDPSVDIHSSPTASEILERVYELYDFCCTYAKSQGKELIFEIGTEEQSGGNNSREELEYTLEKMKDFCDSNKFPYPSFVVIQAGTKVLETQNVGSFESLIRVDGELPPEIHIPRMIEVCNKFGIWMKEHNTDYLTTESLKWQPRLGIHAANIAPEFGVAETRAFVSILRKTGQSKLLDQFLTLSYKSLKWKKWMLKDTQATDFDRSIISGHYVFSTNEYIEIKKRAEKKIGDLDFYLKNAVKDSIQRYIKTFNLRN